MDKYKIKNIIVDCVIDYLESQDINLEVDENTSFVGDKAIIDSMGLVNIIIDIELAFLNKGSDILLVSEKAMSSKNSPFRSVNSLTEYIFESIRGKNG